MRFPALIPALSLAALASSALADGPRDGDVIDLDARHVFVPVGFDDNDETMVVVDGYLPSACYRLTKPEADVDHAARTITVKAKARYFDVPCLDALIPYHVEVGLGVLPFGDYQVRVEGSSLPARKLAVAEARNAGPDDFLYAPIDSANVERDPQTRKIVATMKGRFTSRCMVWDDVRIEDHGDTVNVLPIVKIDPSVPCDGEEVPFRKSVELPDQLTGGRKLLHVRSLNGQAVNHLFFKPR